MDCVCIKGDPVLITGSFAPKCHAENAHMKKESRVIVDHLRYGEGKLYSVHIARHRVR